MKNFKEKEKTFAIWVCGPPATGKNSICEPAILPLDYELIDVDKIYEELLKKYKLNFENITSRNFLFRNFLNSWQSKVVRWREVWVD